MLAAAAALAASCGGRASDKDPIWHIPAPKEPLSMLIMHGMDDQDVPFEGGVSPRRGGQRVYWSVKKSAALWVKTDGCTKVEEKSLYGGKVRVRSWNQCNEDTEVSLYMINGWAHDWPGPYFTSKLPENHPLRQFDATHIIWDFFKRHARE